MQKLPFSELGLSEPVLKAVEKLGFEQTSPIQSAAIPVLMSGKDVVGQSATGSGKTAAFAIPAIERVSDTDRKPQILVLVPTRELATQVAEEFSRLSAFRPKVHAVPIYGGASYERQFSELRKGPQIVIGTPGRIIDHLQRNTLDLSEIKMAVLDECDRMLDMGFREDMERILSGSPKERQTVFFSATLPPPIKRLIETFSKQPEHIRIEGQALTVPTVEQIFFDVPPREKLDALTRLLDIHDARLSIVFANTQRTVDEVTDALLARGYAADRLHGGISQALRTRTMGKFKRSEFEILVATDVAGRGLDVDDLDLVINYDLPYDPEDYVHRIGRTGRAGRKGVAMTLVSGREVYRLQYVERFTKVRIRRGRVPTWDQVEEKRLSEVLDKVRATLEDGNHAAQGIYIDRLLDDGHAATDLAAALLTQLLEAEGIEMKKKEPSERAASAASAASPSAPKAAPASSPAPVAAPASAKPSKEKPAKEKAAPAPAAVSAPASEPGPRAVAVAVETFPDKASGVPEILEATPAEPVPAPLRAIPKPVAPPVEETDEEILSASEIPAFADEDEVDTGEAIVEVPAVSAPAKPKAVSAAPEKPARKPAKPPVVAEEEEELEDDEEMDGEEDEEDDDEAEAKQVVKKPKAKTPSGTAAELPPPAPGFRWITLSAGKEDGLAPRDVVDAITEGGDVDGKSVGLIKIHDHETHVQVKTAIAASVVESLEGATLGDKELNVHFARVGGPPRGKKPSEDRPDRGDRGDRPAFRRDSDDRPRRDYGGFRKPDRPYGGNRPGGFAKKPGGFRKDYGDRDRPARSTSSPGGTGGGGGGGYRSEGRSFEKKPGGFYKKPGGFGAKPGGFHKFGETRQGETRSWSKGDDRPSGDRPRYPGPRGDDSPPRKKYGTPKKGPGRW